MSDQWLHEFEHTGDLGIEIIAQSRVELFRRAAIQPTARTAPPCAAVRRLSGRLLGHREPAAIDLAEVLRVAQEEGCAMEVNSQPDRLDLTDTACMAARRAGVKLAISSDSHSVREFDMLEFGINQARRGWLEAADVLNTRPPKSLHLR